MSGTVVNLNRARKARAKVIDAARAEANRARFGRTKAERAEQAAAAAQRNALLDGAKVKS